MYKEGESVIYKGESYTIVKSDIDHLFLIVCYLITNGKSKLTVTSSELDYPNR